MQGEDRIKTSQVQVEVESASKNVDGYALCVHFHSKFTRGKGAGGIYLVTFHRSAWLHFLLRNHLPSDAK
jgi:hypothetical protein